MVGLIYLYTAAVGPKIAGSYKAKLATVQHGKARTHTRIHTDTHAAYTKLACAYVVQCIDLAAGDRLCLGQLGLLHYGTKAEQQRVGTEYDIHTHAERQVSPAAI